MNKMCFYLFEYVWNTWLVILFFSKKDSNECANSKSQKLLPIYLYYLFKIYLIWTIHFVHFFFINFKHKFQKSFFLNGG